MKNFILIGAAGYIAPRHMKAIKETGNNLIAAYDPYDGVGVMDSHFPQAHFFTEFERFDRHIEKIKRTGTKIDYVSICSPNYLHDSHIRYGLRIGADVICEKPLVLNPWNVDALIELEEEYKNKVHTILQLRHHEAILELKEKIEKGPTDKVYDIDLTYITSRGNWYFTSWKGNEEKSGGIASNIGVHFFDMLQWIFGPMKEVSVDIKTKDTNSGTLKFKQANVNWYLSINAENLPQKAKDQGLPTFRTLSIEGEDIEFSKGFTDLHTVSYQKILNGEGYGLADAKNSIEIVSKIRNQK
ncbi:Gfo/Idh/MocA family oxidoreductase [Flavobacteriaceae bacterium]|nr:Gfo/Idh/MocA family oxidoreductase [Flavobacteriaceae bacterium]MDB4715217.1 Gfo/Idh/MocA family oxidoreductase [Flavobacteriaceae bacterium]